MITPQLRSQLIALAQQYEVAAFTVGDPSWWMHQVHGDSNREATAFVASALSYGSRAQFMPKIGKIIEYAGGEVDAWLRTGAYNSHFAAGDTACYYRLYNVDTMHRFFEAYRQLLQQHGTLGAYIGTGQSGYAAVQAICAWFVQHGAGAVVPKTAASACKRVCMFLRWMVRDGSPVDLGLWSNRIDKRTLIMPLDTHVLQESVRLGLMQSRTASMSAAQHLTDTLSTVFPDDPLRGDFALFGYGVSSTTA